MALSIPHYPARVTKSHRAGLLFPVSRVHRYLKRGRYSDIIQKGAAVYLTGVLEYLVMEVIELGGDAARENKKSRINPRHLKLAIMNDDELNLLVGNVIYQSGGVMPHIHKELLPKPKEDKAKKGKDRQGGKTSIKSAGTTSTGRKSVGGKTPATTASTATARKSVGGKTVPGHSTQPSRAANADESLPV